MYHPYEQNRNDSLTRFIEHDKSDDGHAIRLTTPVQIRQHVADGPGVAFVQLCHGQSTETAAIDATIARLRATIEELEAIRRVKEGVLDLNPARSEGGRSKCRCALFEDATEAVDNLSPGAKLPDPTEPFPLRQPGEAIDDFLARLTATVRDLQRRTVRLECAAEGHPRAE